MDAINEEALRQRLLDECGTAMFCGFPAAFVDVVDIDGATGDELIRMAERLGVNPDDYRMQ